MSEKEVLDLLVTSDGITRVSLVRKIRNAVIGNRKKKRLFLSVRAIQTLVDVWNQNSDRPELATELATVIGSLSLGEEEAVGLLIQDGGIRLLLKGLCSEDGNLVAACLKALRSVYSTPTAPPTLIYQDHAVARKLVGLLLHPSPINDSAATILSKTCQTQDHQNFLFANGIISNLLNLLVSPSPKVVSAGMLCLSSVIKDNSFTSSACIDCLVPGSGGDGGETLLTLLVNLLTYSSSANVKLNVSVCLAELYRSNALSPDNSILTLKLIPSLVSLCKDSVDNSLRVKAANTIADLVSDNVDLQEIASTTDSLLTVLSDFFNHKPNEEDESVDEKAIIMYNSLRQSALRLLACLSSSVEDIRFKVVTKARVMHHLSSAIDSSVVDVKIAAANCLLSLSRSPKLLRTYLSDAEVWKSVVMMLSSTNEDCIKVASSLACNLLHSFCPSREAMIIEGIIPTLARLSSHSNPAIQLNAVWALMNCTREANNAIIKQIRSSLSIDHVILLLQGRQNEEALVMKCLGLLMNLTHLTEECDSIMEEHGVSLVQTLGSVLALSLSDQICEQALCVLVNLSNGCVRSRDRIAECVLVVECLAQLLRTNHDTCVLLACCKLVQNLSDISHNGHSHRQNCLEEVGIQHFLQKLEMVNNSQLQEMARQVLELLQTASL